MEILDVLSTIVYSIFGFCAVTIVGFWLIYVIILNSVTRGRPSTKLKRKDDFYGDQQVK